MNSASFDWQAVITVLKVLLMLVGIVVLAVLVSVLRNAAKLLKSSTKTMDEVDKTVAQLRGSVVPILDKADVTVDAVNAELLRLDGIIASFEAASEKVTHTTDTVSGIVSAPVDLVAGFTDKLKRGWKVRRAEAEDRQ